MSPPPIDAATGPAWLVLGSVVLAAVLALMNGLFFFFAKAHFQRLSDDAREAATDARKAAEESTRFRVQVAEGYPTKTDLAEVREKCDGKVDKGDFARFATEVQKKLDTISDTLVDLAKCLPTPAKGE